MTVLPIATVGHPVLRERARELTRDELASPGMQQLIDDMIDTMRHANGAGIAANQVHVPVRITVIEVNHNPRYPYKPQIPLTIVVNPVIEPIDDELVEINEGCLSVPNLRGNVFRHVNVRVRYWDRHGNEHDEIRRGLTAGGVLGQDAGGVLHRHLVAGERHHARAEFEVQRVQRGAGEGVGQAASPARSAPPPAARRP